MARYFVDVRNDYLGKYRRVSGRSRRDAQDRAQIQLQQWAEQEQRARQRAAISDMKARAVAMTTAAEEDIAEHRSILATSLRVPHNLDWEQAGAIEPFLEQPPTLAQISFSRSVPQCNWFLELLRIRSKEARLRAEAEARAEFERGVLDWEERRHAHELAAAERRREVEAVHEAYPRGEMVDTYLALCLTESDYPATFPTTLEVHYDAAQRFAVVELDVPALTEVPQMARYRFDQARGEIIGTPIAAGTLAEIYDGVVYQTALRVLHEVFDSDYLGRVEQATVNVYANRVNSATGGDERICLATCEAERRAFQQLDLTRVEPRDCFRALNGLVAKRPSGLAQIQPLRAIPRPVDHDMIRADSPEPATGPAPDLLQIDPFEFEQLVGNLFRQLYAAERATVEVTRASHDGGVDVVVTDPDEIKGGKIVIQAKRYKGVIPPGYVRELYGTMLNEGASKGILVATGHFGAEAKEFAQDKPITLVGSEQLLQMLAEHGYDYRIDSGW